MKFPADFSNRIHAAGLSLLEKIGVKVDHEAVYNAVIKAGGKAGRLPGSILFPRQLVADMLALAPAKARFSDLNFNVTELGPGGQTTFWTGAALNIREGRDVKPFESPDLACLARVVDALPNIFAVTGVALADRPPAVRDFAGFRIMAANTRKHLRPLMFTKDGAEPIMEMAKVLLGARKLSDFPIFSLGYSILSPFHWIEIPVNMWYVTRGHRIPVMVNGEPIAGVSSPMTLAGSVAQSNAEILSGIVINQILEPGRPCLYNLGFAHALDMKTTICLSGSPECSLMAAAGGEMARFYNLPSASWMSTESLYGNYQSAAERALNGLIHGLYGISAVWGAGQLESQKSISLAQCVLDNDLAGYIRHFLRGFDTTDAAFAVDEILRQGFDGKYLESDHTLDHFREVLYMPDVFQRKFDNRSIPVEEKDADCVAEKKVRDILSAPPPEFLTREQARALDEIEQRFCALA